MKCMQFISGLVRLVISGKLIEFEEEEQEQEPSPKSIRRGCTSRHEKVSSSLAALAKKSRKKD